MPWFLGTENQARAVISRVNTALGYPRIPGAADRRGAGRHVPFAAAATMRWAYPARLSDGSVGVRIKAFMLARLTAAQRAQVVASLPVGVTVDRENEY